MLLVFFDTEKNTVMWISPENGWKKHKHCMYKEKRDIQFSLEWNVDGRKICKTSEVDFVAIKKCLSFDPSLAFHAKSEWCRFLKLLMASFSVLKNVKLTTFLSFTESEYFPVRTQTLSIHICFTFNFLNKCMYLFSKAKHFVKWILKRLSFEICFPFFDFGSICTCDFRMYINAKLNVSFRFGINSGQQQKKAESERKKKKEKKLWSVYILYVYIFSSITN